jgi:flagellar hook protein FlgE
MGQKLNVTANNVANANSTGFKTGQATFADMLESSMGSGSIGHGVQLSAIDTCFASGSIESTNRETDMAISGPGFFMVRNSDNATANRYTRNGEFDLAEHLGAEPKAYNLVTSSGQFVQGYNLAASTVSPSVVSDILVKKTAPQSATTQVEVVANLENNPALVESVNTPLFSSWDGRSNSSPITDGTYEYKTSLKIYGPDDETTMASSPSSYDYLTIYYDSTANPNEKEFLVTCDPAMDQRLISGGSTRYDSTVDKGAGALLYGTLHFTANGDLSDIECWNVPPSGDVVPSSANKLDLSRGESYYSFNYNFNGNAANATSTINFGNIPKPQAVISPATALTSVTASSPVNAYSSWDSVYDSLGNKTKTGDTIQFQGRAGDGTQIDYTYTVSPSQTMQDLLVGLQNQFACKAEIINGKLNITDTVVGNSQLSIDSISYKNASGANPTADPSVAQIFGSQGASFTIDAADRFGSGPLATTSYASPSATIFQSQNGFGRGDLQGIHVDAQGNIIGQYSNGQDIKQAQFVLADFASLQGLETEGNSTFVATAESGSAILGTAGQGSFGTVTNNALESSNVDLGREMADIIITQRAFQANSKSITTADEIYDTVLQMMRR